MPSNPSSKSPSPLAGVKVVEFTHMATGLACGFVLADLGADVVKIEPIKGDRTRDLLGTGAGFFPMFNRNKKSLAVDLRQPQDVEVAKKLAATMWILLVQPPRLLPMDWRPFFSEPHSRRGAL